MRDGVMDVEQVPIVELSDLGHASRQRKIVWGVVEQGITRNFDFVIMDVGFGAPQPDRLGVGNEVNFVISLGQFQSQLGGYHATAAVGWITGDPDLHARPIVMCGSSPLAWRFRWQELAADADSTRVSDAEADGEGRLLRVLRAKCIAWIDLVQVCLELLLRVIRQSGELDSHPDAGVASANHSTRSEPIFSHPQINT